MMPPHVPVVVSKMKTECPFVLKIHIVFDSFNILKSICFMICIQNTALIGPKFTIKEFVAINEDIQITQKFFNFFILGLEVVVQLSQQ